MRAIYSKPYIPSALLFILHTSYSILHTPLIASAQKPITIFKTPGNLTFTSLADKLSGIANDIIPFLVGVAFVFVMWGVYKYVRSAGDAEKLSEGRKVALWGVVAIFMMLSFWGFVMIIKNSLFG